MSSVLTTTSSRTKIWPIKYIQASRWLGLLSVIRVGSVVVDSLFIVAPIVCEGCVWSLFCCAVLSILSSFSIISLRKRELVALL